MQFVLQHAAPNRELALIEISPFKPSATVSDCQKAQTDRRASSSAVRQATDEAFCYLSEILRPASDQQGSRNYEITQRLQ